MPQRDAQGDTAARRHGDRHEDTDTHGHTELQSHRDRLGTQRGDRHTDTQKHGGPRTRTHADTQRGSDTDTHAHGTGNALGHPDRLLRTCPPAPQAQTHTRARVRVGQTWVHSGKQMRRRARHAPPRAPSQGPRALRPLARPRGQGARTLAWGTARPGTRTGPGADTPRRARAPRARASPRRSPVTSPHGLTPVHAHSHGPRGLA